MACDPKIEYKGKEYTFSEFMAMAHDGLIDIESVKKRLKGEKVPIKINEEKLNPNFGKKIGLSIPETGKQVEKTILGRAKRAENSKKFMEELEKEGLNRNVQKQKDVAKITQKYIDENGIDAALKEIENGNIKGAPVNYIQAMAIQELRRRSFDESLTQEQRDAAAKKQQEIVDAMENVNRLSGQQSAMLAYVYKNVEGLGLDAKTQIERIKGLNGGHISPEAEKKIIEQAEQLQKAYAEIDRLTKEREQTNAREVVDEIIKKRTTKKEGWTKEKAKKRADEFRERFKNKEFVLKDENGEPIKVYKASMLDINELIEVAAKAIEVSGEIADGIRSAKETLKEKEWYKSLSEKRQRSIDRQVENYFGSVPDPKEGLTNSYLKAIVETGVKDYESFIERIKEDFPEMSEREITDAISKYGQEALMTKSELDKL